MAMKLLVYFLFLTTLPTLALSSHIRPALEKRFSSIKVPLSILVPDGLIGVITIGGQDFTVLLDTGSQMLWVYGVDCPGCPENRKKYKPSPTYSNMSATYNMTYLDHSGSFLNFGKDTVTINHQLIEKQPFGHAISTNINGTTSFDGVFGLGMFNESGFAFANSSSGLVPIKVPTQSLSDGNIISYNSFSIWTSPSGEGGEILFGDIDKSRHTEDLIYYDLNTNPSYNSPFWFVRVKSIKFGSLLLPQPSVDLGLVDSGTAIIQLSKNAFEKIKSIIKPDYIDKETNIMFVNSIKNLPNIVFAFGEGQKEFTIPSAVYTLYIEESKLYQVLIGSYDSESDCTIIGFPFFKTHYIDFDIKKRRIGFARTSPSISSNISDARLVIQA